MQLHRNELRTYIAIEQRLRALSLLSTFDYFERPDAFAAECISWPAGSSLAPYQSEGLAGVQRYRRYAFCGPHGLGKTTVEALVTLWFAITREAAGVPWKVLVTAGSWGQLRDYYFPEVHLWASRLDWSKIPLVPFTTDQLLDFAIKLDRGRVIAKSSKKFQEGAHSPHLLFIGDEAKSIPAAAFDSAEGAMSTGNCFGFVASTPEDPEGRFHAIMTGAEGLEHWTPRWVTQAEVLAAGRMDRQWAERMRKQWGEHSKLYLNKACGRFAEFGSDSLIPAKWVERAFDLYRAWKEVDGELKRITSLGSDVAAGGRDQTINAIRQGKTKITLPDWFAEKWGESGEITIDLVTEFATEASDVMQATGAIAARLNANPGACAVVDIVNIGEGVVSRLRELGLNVIPVRGGKKTQMRDMVSGELEFADLRSALIFHFAQCLNPLNGRNLAFPPWSMEGRPSLLKQITAPKYKEESTGKIRVESKEKIRPRLGGSTDAFDALVYAYSPEADGIFKAWWWRFWRPAEMRDPSAIELMGPSGELQEIASVVIPERFDLMLQSWHTAYRDDDTMQKPTFAVGMVQAWSGNDCYVRDLVRARQDFPSACASMMALTKQYPGAAQKLVDVTTNGKAVVHSMRRQVSGIRAIEPAGGMLISRANAVGVGVFGGNVFLPHPETAPWVMPFIQECAEFPNGPNAEQVSAFVLGVGARRTAVRKEREISL